MAINEQVKILEAVHQRLRHHYTKKATRELLDCLCNNVLDNDILDQMESILKNVVKDLQNLEQEEVSVST